MKLVAVPRVACPESVKSVYCVDRFVAGRMQGQEHDPGTLYWNRGIPARSVYDQSCCLIDPKDEHLLRPVHDNLEFALAILVEMCDNDPANFERLALRLMSLARGRI